jgi:lipoprotein-releasing system permease protein
MNPMFEWMVAARYLRARRAEGFISVIVTFSLLGIALGVATLIVVLSVMNGFREELLTRILGLEGHLTVQSVAGPMTDFDDLAARVNNVSGVVGVRPVIYGEVMATTERSADGALVRGIRLDDLRSDGTVSEGIIAGSLDTIDLSNDVIIGYRLAQKLGVRVGDIVTLLSPQGTPSPIGTVPRSRAYRIGAVFDVGMLQYDSRQIFMPIGAAQIFFRTGNGVSALEVRLDDPDDVERARERIFPVTGGARLTDWQQINSHYFNALQVERNVMFLILTLIILVAAFNIISSLIMLVKDKGSDIAILRTMGATRGMIMRIFFIAGASVGVVGTLAGLGLGLAFAANIEAIRRWLESLTGTELFAAEIYFLSQLPAKVDPTEVVTVVLMAIALSLLATIYPSWRAARLDPVEALRYE